MTHADITTALAEVRDCGQDFTKAFNHLSEMVEAMAKENETLRTGVKVKDADLVELTKKAKQAEADAWTMIQSNEKLTAQVLELNQQHSDTLLLKKANEAQAHTILDLRQEVSKLLEVILTVATSVDGVVNKPKPEETHSIRNINPDPYHPSNVAMCA